MSYEDATSWYQVARRVPFDVLFWVVINVIVMNMIFGIIVDTFSQLRDEKWSIQEDMNSLCSICSIRAYDFDQKTSGGFKCVVGDSSLRSRR